MRRIAVTLCAALLLGCRETTSLPSPASLRLTHDSVVVFVDSTVRVRAAVVDAMGDTIVDPRVAWWIPDTTVASVILGHVYGLKTGMTELIAATDSFLVRIPVRVVDRFVAVPAGGVGCFLAAGGRVYCILGGSVSTTGRVASERRFRQLYESFQGGGSGGHCGITESGELWCWGDPTSRPLVMHQAYPGYRYRQYAAAGGGSCALTVQGQLMCWPGAIDVAPTLAAPTLTFRSLAAGYTSFCAVATGGDVWCWGDNRFGQLGVHGTYSSTVPLRVAQVPAADTVIAGQYHHCALTPTHETWCWGYNYNFQIGDTTGSGCYHYGTRPVCTEVPVRLANGLPFVGLAASSETTCGLLGTGALQCWGLNAGTYGDGSTSGGPTPVPAASGRLFRSVTGAWSYLCGLAMDDRVYCWGGLTRVPEALPFQP